jgi:hypothetical protein
MDWLLTDENVTTSAVLIGTCLFAFAFYLKQDSAGWATKIAIADVIRNLDPLGSPGTSA